MILRKPGRKRQTDNAITSDDILGKGVIDTKGQFIGVVEKLHIDPNNLDILAISVDKGFLKKGLIIGKGYIRKVTPHALFLKVRPAHSIKGMLVFDLEGMKMGTVTGIALHGRRNSIKHLMVSSGMLGKDFKVSSDIIKSIGHNVFLTEKKEDLEVSDSKELVRKARGTFK